MAITALPQHSVSAPAPRKGLRLERYFTHEGVHPYDEIEWELRDAVIPGEGGNVFEQRGVEVPKFWSATATNVVASKYFRGKLTSPEREWSVKQMVDRVVDQITAWGIEVAYGTFVEATGDHLVSITPSYGSGARANWMRVDEVQPGMRMRLQTDRVASMAAQAVPVLQAAEVIVRQAASVYAGDGSDPTELDDFVTLRMADGDVEVSEAALAGWLQGDGFVGQYDPATSTNSSLTIEFEVANQEERSWVLKHLDIVFPNVHRNEGRHPDLPEYRKIRLYGEVLRRFVTKYGLLNRRDAIRVPDAIWDGHPSAVNAYLKSVFQTDGYICVRRERRTITGAYGRTTVGQQGLAEVATISKAWMQD